MPKAPGEWRVGLLGDSFTAGVGVEQNQRFGDVWFETAKQRDTALWNLASPLCGTMCEAEILDGPGREYQLDEIVLAFYGGNDLADNAEWYQKAEPPKQSAIRGWLRENSRLASFVWVNAIRSFASFKPPGIYSAETLRDTWPDTERSLARLREAAGARRLTILYLPSPPEWDDNLWRVMRERYGAAGADRFIVRQAVEEWAGRNNISFIDTTRWLRECPSVKECTLPVDPHWNARGQSLLAKGLVAQLQVGPR